MKWIKKGLIYKPRGEDWMKSHAQCPTAIVLGDKIRIFFSVRDYLGESLPTYIDVSKMDPSKIVYEHNKPILLKGRLGTFDENGIIPSYIVEEGDDIYLYYAGWSRCVNVPYKNFTGVAISKDGGNTFIKYSEAPVLSLENNSPLSATGPCIVKRDNIYHCIYSTGIEWIDINSKLEHTYLLISATSKDGFSWETNNKVVIQPENEFIAHCKPAVYYDGQTYHMWFSKRGSHNFRNPSLESYRLGYATSRDFFNWDRRDSECGIDVSEEGWDSEMICYPHIIKNDDTVIMFYNGNGFGKSGFGYTELIKS